MACHLMFDETFGRVQAHAHSCCLELQRIALFSPPESSLHDLEKFLEVEKDVIQKAMTLKDAIIQRIIEFSRNVGEVWLLNKIETMPSKLAADSLREFNEAFRDYGYEELVRPANVKKSRIAVSPVKNAAARELPMLSVSTMGGAMDSVSAWGATGALSPAPSILRAPLSPYAQAGSQGISKIDMRSQRGRSRMTGASSVLLSEGTGLTFTDRSFFRINARRFFSLLCLIDFRIQRSLYLCVESNLCKLYEHWNKPFMVKSRISASTLLSSTSRMLDKSCDDVYMSLFFRVTAGIPIKNSKCGLMTVTLQPTANGDVELSTSSEEVINQLLSVFKSILEGGVYLSPLVKNAAFATMLLPVVGEVDKSDLTDLIHTYKDSDINNILVKCLETLSKDTELCDNIASLFKPMSKKFDDVTQLAATICDEMVCHNTPSELSELMRNLQEDKDKFSELPDCTDVGLLRLQIGSFKNIMNSALERCVQLLHEELPRVFLRRGHNFVDGVLAVTDLLLSKPKNVSEFVKLLNHYNNAIRSEEAQRDESIYLAGLKQVMDDYHVDQSTRVTDMASTLTVVYHRYLKSMNHFRDNVDERTEIFKKELFGLVKDIQKPIETAYNRLCSDIICNPNSKCTTALAELDSIRLLVRDITRSSEVIVKSQEAMELSVFDKMSVVALSELLSCNLVMWNSIDEIRVEHYIFISSPIKSVDYKMMIETLYNTRRKMFAFDALATGKVAELLEKMVSEKYDEIPMIVYLQEPYLQTRHKTEIEQVLGTRIYHPNELRDVEHIDAQPILELKTNDLANQAHAMPSVNSAEGVIEEDDFPEVKVMDVISPHFLQKTHLIKAICDKAKREFNIRNELKTIENTCHKLIFHSRRLAEDKSIVLFVGLDEILMVLQECSVSVDSCLGSIYCTPHLQLAKYWQELLPEWILSVQNLADIQRTYLLLRNIYHSSRSARYFHQSMRSFNVVEENWKFIMQSIVLDPKVMFLVERQGFKESVDLIQSGIFKTMNSVDTLLNEQCSKWPKLYLLYKEKLLQVLCKRDPVEIFTSCQELLPGVSSFTFGGPDHASASHCLSFGEEITLHHPISSKLPLPDFLRSVEQSMTDRLMGDVNELLDDTDKIYKDSGVNLKGVVQMQRWCNQSKVLVFQIHFWSEFNMCFNGSALNRPDNAISSKHSHNIERKTMAVASIYEKMKLLAASSRIRLEKFVEAVKHVKSRPGLIGNANILIATLRHRDIVSALMKDADNISDVDSEPGDLSFLPFWILCSTQTLWANASSNAVLVQGITGSANTAKST